MISSKLLKNSILYTIVGSLPLASGLILLPFYTNYLKGVDTYGILTLYINFSLLVQVIVNFSLDSSIGIHYFEYKDDPDKLKKYIGTLVSLLLVIGGIFLLISFLLGDTVLKLIFSDKAIVFLPFGLMSILSAIFFSFYKTYSNLLINQQRTIRFFWVNILYFLTYIVFTLGGLYIFPYQIDGPIWGRLLSSVLLFMICLYFFAREYGISLHKEYVTETFFFCLPLVYYSIIMWVTNYGDRYIINFMLKKFDVGIYDFALKVTLLIDVVLMALTNTINPVIYRIWSEKKIKHSTDEINQNHHFFTLTQLFLIALTLLVMPLAVPLFVKNTDYFTSFQYLPILVLGFLFRSLSNMYMMPLLYYKKTKVLPKVFLISSVIQIAAGFVFIKYWGIWGVVISFVITKPIQVWLLARESSKVYEFKFNKAKMIYLPMVYGISLICFYSIGTKFVDRIYMDILQFVFCCTLIGIVFWNEINEKILSRFLAKK